MKNILMVALVSAVVACCGGNPAMAEAVPNPEEPVVSDSRGSGDADSGESGGLGSGCSTGTGAWGSLASLVCLFSVRSGRENRQRGGVRSV